MAQKDIEAQKHEDVGPVGLIVIALLRITKSVLFPVITLNQQENIT